MISVQLVRDETECEKLWRSFNQDPDFWNLWEVRRCFHADHHDFHFLKHVDNGKEIGLLPLIYDKEWKCYSYLGGFYPENNRLMIKDRDYAPALVSQLPPETVIYCLNSDDAALCALIQRSDKHYFLNVGDHTTFEGFLTVFSKKHRKNLLHDLKKVHVLGPEIVHDREGDFERLVELNRHRFGPDSDYHDETILREMRELLALAKKANMLDIISVLVEGKVIGVALGIHHKGVYYSINTGRDLSIENLGKFLIGEQIRSAIEKKCARIDFLTGDDPWKELWNLEWEYTYELVT